MKPRPFSYSAPTTVAEAVSVLAELGDEAKPLAGGQSLIPMLALRLATFDHLVDIGRIEALTRITLTPAGATVGATARQRQLERDGALAAAVPLLALAAPLIGHFQVRNRGTIGGSLAHADPASELPAVAVALGARFEIEGPGGARRTLEAADFFAGTWTTALRADELLAAVHFPAAPARAGDAIVEMARREGDFAIAGAAAHVELDGAGRVSRLGLGLFGVGPAPVAARDACAAARGHAAGELDAGAVAQAALQDVEPTDDVHATATQRRRIVAHLTEQAVRGACQRAVAG